MMRKLFVSISVLLASCSFQDAPPQVALMDLIEEENPVAVDWVRASSGDGTSFKWYYSSDEYMRLKKLNFACNEWFENASPDIKASMIISLEDEARGAALPNTLNTLESYSSEKDITRYLEYFTASYTFFANPSYKTKQYFLSNNRTLSEESFHKKTVTEHSGDNDFLACYMFSPLMGAIGFEGFAKDSYDRMANVIGTKNRADLLEQADKF